jgi:hypothetical protein
MSLNPPSVELEAELEELYEAFINSYFFSDGKDNFLGYRSMDVAPFVLEPRSSFLLEIPIKCPILSNFLQVYKNRYMWFQGSSCERITAEDRKSSKYKPFWTILDNFFEDSARQYQRFYNLPDLYGMFETFDVCSTAQSLNFTFNGIIDNYKIACLVNFGSSDLSNVFINYPDVQIKSNFLYLFPSSFTHSLSSSFCAEEIFTLLGGFA